MHLGEHCHFSKKFFRVGSLCIRLWSLLFDDFSTLEFSSIHPAHLLAFLYEREGDYPVSNPPSSLSYLHHNFPHSPCPWHCWGCHVLSLADVTLFESRASEAKRGCWEDGILEAEGACWHSLAVVLHCPTTSMPVPGLPASFVFYEPGAHPSTKFSVRWVNQELLAAVSTNSFLPVRKGWIKRW